MASDCWACSISIVRSIGRFDDQDAEGLNELVTVFVAHEEGLGL